MTAKQTRRLLIVAFVLSLILHLIAAGFLRWPFKPSEEDQPQIIHVVHIRQIRIARATPTPPPPPSPKPVRSAAPTASPAVAHRATAVRGTLPAQSARTVAQAASPSPAATATPNCLRTDTPVTIAASPPPPEIPASARTSQTGGTARIDVTIDSSGNVTAAAIGQTSGDGQLDQIALLMAREARYAPATHACKPVTSQYAYTVKFVAW